MGLSILIPVYNVNVTGLVHALAEQLRATGKKGEIVLLDDGSDNKNSTALNQSLENITSVAFHCNPANEGRMAARQKLSRLARYDYLLFLDCDSVISKEDFLSAYFILMDAAVDVASGGRVYTAHPPDDCALRLHWTYGTKRENRSPDARLGKGPGFMSNNFLIKKQLFAQLDSSTELTGYGHEDSWWGIQFEQLGAACRTINNPVLHGELETAEMFIAKSDQALANLFLLEKKIGKNLLKKHVRIFRWYCLLRRNRLAGLYLFFEKPFHTYFRKNLLSCKPQLFFFDCYRLARLIQTGRATSAI